MKFTRFLKIFGIALGSFFGAIGIGIGIMAIGGAFNEPNIQPAEIAFEYSEYKEDSDFEVKVTTKTENVTKTEIELSFPNASEITERDGKISDGVITIPKTVKLGQKFKVELVKVINDSECDGQDWIKGGHSVIRATSSNPDAESARAVIHIDVPVYNVELETRVSENEPDSNIFVLDTAFYANLKFYPQRSAYQYSFDGQNGYDVVNKNAYFMLATGNDTYISQVGTTNEFVANEVGNNSVINGFAFGRTKREESVLSGIGEISGQERHNAILQEIRTILGDQSQVKEAFSASKSVDIIDIDVDKLESNVLECRVPDVYVATKYTAYANNKNMTGAFDMNFALRLLSNYDRNVSLQSKLNNVGITFLYKQGSTFYKAINNDNAVYNVIEMPQGGYGRTQVVAEEDEEEYTYFFPVITSSVDNYHWEFAVSRYCDTDSIYIKIKYFDNEVEIEPILLSFSTKIVVSNAISWSSTDDIDLTIIDGEEPVYEDYDIKPRAVVPQANLYQTKKYFAYSSNNQTLTDYIYAKDAVTYTLGSQGFDLYELSDGIIQPHSKSAHGVSFNVIFVTVQTDYNGREIIVNGKYVINQYSQDSYGAISPINVSITKTLYSISYNLVTTDDDADLIKFTDDATGFDALAYVDGTLSPFDVIVTYQSEQGADDEVEKNIFRQAIVNGDINVIATTNVTPSPNIVAVSGVTEQMEGGILSYRFSLTIKELPMGTSDLRVSLNVAYNKGKVEELYRVSTYNDESNLAYIEVYNGEAVTFAFNLNICDDGDYATSQANPVNVQTTLTSSLREDNEYYVDTIDTKYRLNNVEISNKLFVTTENIVDYGNLNVVVQDKHGKYPKSSVYVLESSNTSALVVTDNNTIVFTGTGDAELRLLHKNEDGEYELKDTLYFTSLNEGSVSKVTKYEFLSNDPVVEYQKNDDEYDFKTITMPINGYAGLTINFKNTSVDNNLLTYYYSYDTIDKSNLINQMVHSLANTEDTQLEESGHVTFDRDVNGNLTAIKFNRDFGQRRTIQILVTVKELGISQIVILDVKPNVSISATPKDNPIVVDPKGSAIYNNGIQLTPVYADSVYKIEVVLDYTIKPTSSVVDEYSFVIYDPDSQDQSGPQSVKRMNDGYTYGNDYVYIAKIFNVSTQQEVTDSVSIKRDVIGDSTRYTYEYYFVFTSQANTLAKTLILSLKQEQTTPVDTQKDLYLSINQNVKVELNGDNDLYLNTQYSGGIYGKSVLYGNDDSKIKLSRIVNNGDVVSPILKDNLNVLDKAISIDIKSNQDKFVINGYELSSTSPIINCRVVNLDVLYNNTIISNISLNVHPNITKNLDSDLWVLYGKDNPEFYLKLVSNNFYLYDDLYDAFNLGFDNAYISIDFADDFIKNYLSQAKDDYDEYGVQVARIDDRIIADDLLLGQLIFKNGATSSDGDRITFKIIILPCQLPFVIYPDVDIDYTQENLYDILDLEYLKANIDRFHYTVQNSGKPAGENIWFEPENTSNVVGIQHFVNSNVHYEVKNLIENDLTNYAYIDQYGVLHTEQVGEDTYVVVYAVLNELYENSLVVPYIVKIPKELLIQTYYPYTQYASQNDYNLCGEDMLASEPEFDMEYLAFQNGVVQIDMFERFSQNTPNSKNGFRYVIGKINESSEFERVENLSALSEVSLSVTEVWYYAPGWKKAQNVDNYATFSSNANGYGLLTISQYGGTEKLRIRIEITTRSKIVAAYYISVGEIPSLILTDRNGTTADSTKVVDANDNNIDIGFETYRLLKELKNGRTDATYLLNFYSIAESYEEPNITIDNQTKIMTTSESTINWETDLVAYTIYGEVKVITLQVKSNYEHYLENNDVLVYDENEKVYKVNSGTVLIITDLFIIRDRSSQAPISTLNGYEITVDSNYDQIYANDNKVCVGSVSDYTLVNVSAIYKFGGAPEKEYNFDFTLKVMPYVSVNTVNNIVISKVNMLDKGDVPAGEDVVFDIMSSLFKFGDSQEEKWNAWIDNILSNSLGGFEVTLITENISESLFNASILLVDNVYKIQVNTSPVAIQTRISFKVSLFNKYNGEHHELIASYFTFIVTPTFRLSINYPRPNNDAVVAGETYLYTAGSSNNINFNNGKAIFSEGNRIQIETLSGNSVSSDDIYITTTSNLIKKGSVSLNTIPHGVSLTEASFTIDDFTGEDEIVVFGIYFKVDENNYTALGSYNLLLCKSVVFTAIKINYNNVGTNEQARPEAIYIGNNSEGVKDNVMSRIKVAVKIPTNADIQKDLYIQITKVGGMEVVCKPQSFGNGSSGETFTLNTYIESDMISMTSSTIEYRIFEKVEEDEIECELVDLFGNVVEPTFTPSSRISIIYKALTSVTATSEQTSSETVDFFKMYNALNINDININESDVESSSETFEKEIKINGEYELGKYYIDYKFDVIFDTQTVSLSTGESTTLLKNSGSVTSDYYRPLLNMKRLSNGSYYKPEDFARGGLKFDYVEEVKSVYTSNPTTDAPAYGYLSMTPVIKDDGLIYDYIFLAMGAPKEDSITVTLKVVVSYGSLTKKFDMTFVVSHDYENEYLRNSNDTINRQTDRNKLLAGEEYIFAISGSTNQLENFVYITHSNKTMAIYSGNVASFFSLTFENGGAQYVEKYSYNDNHDLKIEFKNLNFGNVNLDIIFRDAYGYEFVYYVQIVAKYNPTYDSGDVTIYEKDTVYVTEPGSTDQSSVNLTITIEKQDDLPSITVEDLDEISLKFIPNEIWSESERRMVKNYTEIPSAFEKVENGGYVVLGLFETGFISEKWFKIGESGNESVYAGDIAGKLYINLQDEGDETEIVVNAVLKERYTLKTSTTPYVRDDVPFSLVDIVDVVDNKSSITIGERLLKDVKSVYITYDAKEGGADGTLIDGNPFDSDEHRNFNNNFSIGIQAINKNKGTVTKKLVTDESGSYISLLDLFDIESIEMLKNYSFKMYYECSDDVTDFAISNGWTKNILSESEYNTELATQHAKRCVTIAEKVGEGETPSFTYYFEITLCYIIDDQELSVAVQKVYNLSTIAVQLYSTNGLRFINVPVDKTEIKTFSLRKAGLITNANNARYELYTNSDRTVIRGISNDDLLKLKGFEFVGGEGYDVVTNNTVTKHIVKSDDEDTNPTFKVSTDGNNVLYNEGLLKIKVRYAFVNGVPVKTKENYTTKLRITLKFVDLDTTYAYGSDIARKIMYYGDEGINQFKTNGISLEDWAGSVNNRPVYVVPGYTNATSFAHNEARTLVENNADFEYSINTTESTSGNYVSIDSTGKITIESQDKFDFENNYIAIDVKVKYGENKDNVQLIDTVLVKFRNIQAGVLNASLRNNKLVWDGAQATSKNIAEMISLNDSSDSSWTGQDIINAFGTKLMWTSYLMEDEPQNADEFDEMTNKISFDKLEPRPLLTSGSSTTNIAIRAQGQSELIYLRNIVLTKSEFESSCIIANDEYGFELDNPTNDVIYNKLKGLVKFKNIYNDIKTAQDIGFVLYSTEQIDQNYYKVESEALNNVGEEHAYKVTFGYNSTIYGSVIVRTYKTKTNQVLSYLTNYSGEDSNIFLPSSNTWDLSNVNPNLSISRVIRHGTSINIEGYTGTLECSGASIDGNIITINDYTDNKCEITLTVTNGEGEGSVKTYYFTVYDDVFEYLKAVHNVNGDLLQVRLVKGDGGDEFEEYVALEQNVSGYSLKVYKPNPDGDTTCKLQIYFTYTDDFTGEQKEVVVYKNDYTFIWNE